MASSFKSYFLIKLTVKADSSMPLVIFQTDGELDDALFFFTLVPNINHHYQKVA